MSENPGELRKMVLGVKDTTPFDTKKTDQYWRLCAMQLATSSSLLMVMQAMVELGVLEIISKAGAEGTSAEEIASQLELTKDATITTASSMLDRMLRLLAAHSILTCANDDVDENYESISKKRLYVLGPIGIHFVPNSNGVSFAPYMLLVQDKVYMNSWSELKPAVLEGGIPFKRAYGMPIFEYAEKDPRFNEVFNQAMINSTAMIVTDILNSYKGFEKIIRVVDVGGGLGVALKLITSKYPHIKGINFDLPHVIQHASPYPGVEHIAGNMFESVPGGDAIFMKSILHDWSDDHCLKLLKNCHKALSENGKVIIVEGILPVTPDNSLVSKSLCQDDLIMMTQSPGGQERTKQEFLSLATAAGFSSIHQVCFVYSFCVMEFHK